MIALFEKYSQTSDNPKSKITPISIKKSRLHVFNKVLEYLQKEEYDEITYKKDFFEIYCCDRDYEISIFIYEEGGFNSMVNIAVYGEKKRGRTRRKLKEFKQIIEELFESDV